MNVLSQAWRSMYIDLLKTGQGKWKCYVKVWYEKYGLIMKKVNSMNKYELS